MDDRYLTNIYTAFEDRYGVLKDNSRHNRRNPTEAEHCLWHLLRKDALGVKFRRQHAIGDYIADFVCLDRKLIIEVDGGYHLTVEQQSEDMARAVNLESLGFRIIRFSNEQVMFDSENVIRRIKENLQ